MKIIIHRGTNQIGGCITEITSDSGTKILIDIGANLPDSQGIKKTEIELEGLTKGEPSFDAIFITHYHGDHICDKYQGEILEYVNKNSRSKLYKFNNSQDTNLFTLKFFYYIIT